MKRWRIIKHSWTANIFTPSAKTLLERQMDITKERRIHCDNPAIWIFNDREFADVPLEVNEIADGPEEE